MAESGPVQRPELEEPLCEVRVCFGRDECKLRAHTGATSVGEAGPGELFPPAVVLTLPPGFPGGELGLEVEGAGGVGAPEEAGGVGAVLDATVDGPTDVAGAVVGVVEVFAGTEVVLVVVAAGVVVVLAIGREVEVVGCTWVVGGVEVVVTWPPGWVARVLGGALPGD
ncbi:hypothetical protein FIBSPDRAFT_501420 [Athelia psychrophila]|uniref:Uncharacterized protein n=1 Tax=Athelia psychrophila TaxID=1759441 RepID=A0A166KCF1_9AGAM|nr:hypothetical protein FIBSPDRAFT_501420 [Fibularhizoctonia sp. CBS 109695]